VPERQVNVHGGIAMQNGSAVRTWVLAISAAALLGVPAVGSWVGDHSGLNPALKNPGVPCVGFYFTTCSLIDLLPV
jgi:hypothetical protein